MSIISTLGEKAQSHPLAPGCDLYCAVQPQAHHRGSPDGGVPQQLPTCGSDVEMVFPSVCAWMEQTDHCLTRGILATDMRSLIEITRTAGQCPVGYGILAATGDRHDMFHLQGQVEHRF